MSPSTPPRVQSAAVGALRLPSPAEPGAQPLRTAPLSRRAAALAPPRFRAQQVQQPTVPHVVQVEARPAPTLPLAPQLPENRLHLRVRPPRFLEALCASPLRTLFALPCRHAFPRARCVRRSPFHGVSDAGVQPSRPDLPPPASLFAGFRFPTPFACVQSVQELRQRRRSVCSSLHSELYPYSFRPGLHGAGEKFPRYVQLHPLPERLTHPTDNPL